MPAQSSLEALLGRLEDAKRQFGTAAQRELPALIESLSARRFPDAQSLIRFHEALLFFRAYPPSARVLRLTETLLESFAARLARLRGDPTPFEEPDVSGIAGTAFSAIFSYDIARWLARQYPRETEIDWDATDPALLGPLLVRLNPMFAEDALVEANIPYLDWFRRTKTGRGSDLSWLCAAMERLEIPAVLFDHARLAIRWTLNDSPSTRTKLRLSGSREYFIHNKPLIRRADVSLAAELESPPLELEKLSRARGEKMLDLFRATSAMRYRELHGFTYGDAAHMLRANLGRRVEFYVCGVPKEHRLPLRAYHAGMFFKNGVPLGYIECLTFFERIEVGFNLYYTFREGETAWLYARLLRIFRQMLNVSSFAVDPYQVGFHNEEAIESGAFWFYRKLGFRPANPQVGKLLAAEEAKLGANPGYRTSPATLRRLAAGWMLYEQPGAPQGDWDNFEIRRAAMTLDRPPFSPEIQRAKNSTLESTYVRALQRDPQLRRKLIGLSKK